MAISKYPQAAWLTVFTAMGRVIVDRMSREDAEILLDQYFARVDETARQMFPETAGGDARP
jgi:hypothetical protein